MSERTTKFLDVLDHVYGHMSSEDAIFNDFRRDDHYTVLGYSQQILDACRSGRISLGEIGTLFPQQIRPKGTDWTFYEVLLGEISQEEEPTGKRSDL